MENELPLAEFDRIRAACDESMTLVDRLPEGNLYYYEGFSTTLWLLKGAESLVVAYFDREDYAAIVARSRLWNELLKLNLAPPLNDAGATVFGGTIDPSSGNPRVHWLKAGDWLGLISKIPLPQKKELLPKGWPESYRKKITELLTR